MLAIVAFWSIRRRIHSGASTYLVLAPRIVDYPLREPGRAVLMFLLMGGALAGRRQSAH
jgi:hypothetical protein